MERALGPGNSRSDIKFRSLKHFSIDPLVFSTRRETPSSAVGAGGDVPGPPMVGEIQHPSGSQPLSRVGLPERAMRSYTGCISV